MEIRPENEYDKLLRLSNEHYQDINECRPCGGYSLRYECACDFHQIQCNRAVQVVSQRITFFQKEIEMILFSLLIPFLLIEYPVNLHFENLKELYKKNGYQLLVLYVIMTGLEK